MASSGAGTTTLAGLWWPHCCPVDLSETARHSTAGRGWTGIRAHALQRGEPHEEKREANKTQTESK
eukprot:1505521-Prymnesium_polylepis.2